MSKTYKVGEYSAYAIAVKYGYTGTEAEWNNAVNAARTAAEAAATEAQTIVDNAKSGIQAEGTKQIGLVNTAGQTQLAAIKAVEDDIAANYPKYDAVVEDINDIKTEIATCFYADEDGHMYIESED